MALKLRKDIKKSSYYVWFLGAKESKGLRGAEYIIPVIRHLEEREKDVEPFKVTLQVSHKGLKIIQSIVSQGQKTSKPKNETIKHFIPHNTITYVYQHEDIIACILLLFNPVTKCPLHVHAYRCDSLETASHLKQQLQILIDRPENQKKISEIENRLKPIEKIKKIESSLGSDTGASTRESESSSEERFALENSRISSLYESVAAELRAKLCKKSSPILLPPRDYDTVHRQKGNLTGIELRRCLNANIVGQNVKTKRLESSGGSSGIGSDHPPSPENPDGPEARFHLVDTHSTSEDEDWDPGDTTLYLMNENRPPISLTRSVKDQENVKKSLEPQRFSRYAHEELKFSKSYDEDYCKSMSNNIAKYLESPIMKFTDNKYLQRQKSIKETSDDREKYFLSRKLAPHRAQPQYHDDDGFDENIRNYEKDPRTPRSFSYEGEIFFEDLKSLPKTRQRHVDARDSKPKSNPNDPRYYQQLNTEKYYYEGSINRRHAQFRQRSPSPEEVKAPRDRFKDAKEKFLLMEMERLEQARRNPEPLISPHIQRDKIHFVKRHQSMAYTSKDLRNTHEDSSKYSGESRPKPLLRNSSGEVRYRPKEGFRNMDKYDPKRRSMFSLIEEEHKRNSNEIAKELKRRSYVDFDHHNFQDEDPSDLRSNRHFQDLPEADRFNSMIMDSGMSKCSISSETNGKFIKNQKGLKPIPGYRHSYAEPKMKLELQNKKGGGEMLHRTNSSVGYLPPRVGIADIHPY
ncbi:hypothetical protein ABEB36_014323 [Hypothenemus hampei]|uniref:PID domain-containing protein n=1 Tax=Hypothenemus hampei TaxID=57062 RepID=A0ABD1E426_HYPHA